jgi:Flp pilus assembly protein TadD
MEVGASKIKKFKRVLRRDPNSSEANLGLALIYFKRGELVEALPYAEKAAQIDPASADARALLGSIYMGLDRDAKAEQCLAEAIKLNAGNYDPYSRLAEVRHRRSDIAGAVRVLQDAAELFPRNSQTFNDLGVMYYARGDLSEAEKQFNKAREMNPKDRDALFNLSVVHLDQGQAAKAAETLRQLIEVEPDRPEHHASLGGAYQASGNHDDAVKHFQKAVALNSEDGEAHYGLGVSLLQLGQRDASLRSFERCLELQPEHTGAIFAMIGSLAKEGKNDAIAQLWEKSTDVVSRVSTNRPAIRPKLSAGTDVTSAELMEKIERTVAALPEETVELSAVVPALSEAQKIRLLHDRLTSALESTGKRYEIVYVDDGGSDNAGHVLNQINRGDDRVRIVNLAKAGNRDPCLEAGFDHARGDIVVALDADLPPEPQHIQKLIDTMEEGYDAVIGVPTAPTPTPASRKVRTFLANLVTGVLAGIKVRDRQCMVALYNRAVVQRMGLSGDMYRCLPSIADGLGLATAEVQIEAAPRDDDASGPESASATPPVLDVITARFLANSGAGPMRYFGRLGLWSIAVGVLISALVLVWAVRADAAVAWVAFPILLFALGGMLLITAGFVTEMVARSCRQVQRRASYVVKEVIE